MSLFWQAIDPRKMGPRKIHKLRLGKYLYMRQFLTKEWTVVHEERGNVDTLDNASIDAVWDSFQYFLEHHGYAQDFCSKILLGKLLHEAGVEKIKRGPRKGQKFYYFPLKPVTGSRAETIVTTNIQARYNTKAIYSSLNKMKPEYYTIKTNTLGRVSIGILYDRSITPEKYAAKALKKLLNSNGKMQSHNNDMSSFREAMSNDSFINKTLEDELNNAGMFDEKHDNFYTSIKTTAQDSSSLYSASVRDMTQEAIASSLHQNTSNMIMRQQNATNNVPILVDNIPCNGPTYISQHYMNSTPVKYCDTHTGNCYETPSISDVRSLSHPYRADAADTPDFRYNGFQTDCDTSVATLCDSTKGCTLSAGYFDPARTALSNSTKYNYSEGASYFDPVRADLSNSTKYNYSEGASYFDPARADLTKSTNNNSSEGVIYFDPAKAALTNSTNHNNSEGGSYFNPSGGACDFADFDVDGCLNSELRVIFARSIAQLYETSGANTPRTYREQENIITKTMNIADDISNCFEYNEAGFVVRKDSSVEDIKNEKLLLNIKNCIGGHKLDQEEHNLIAVNNDICDATSRDKKNERHLSENRAHLELVVGSVPKNPTSVSKAIFNNSVNFNESTIEVQAGTNSVVKEKIPRKKKKQSKTDESCLESKVDVKHVKRNDCAGSTTKRSRGRPRGSKNKKPSKKQMLENHIDQDESGAKLNHIDQDESGVKLNYIDQDERSVKKINTKLKLKKQSTTSKTDCFQRNQSSGASLPQNYFGSKDLHYYSELLKKTHPTKHCSAPGAGTESLLPSDYNFEPNSVFGKPCNLLNYMAYDYYMNVYNDRRMLINSNGEENYFHNRRVSDYNYATYPSLSYHNLGRGESSFSYRNHNQFCEMYNKASGNLGVNPTSEANIVPGHMSFPSYEMTRDNLPTTD